jgi:HAD superfamily hydrolase (TIGR01509 family)
VDGVGYTWNARGNLISDGTFTYAYNAAGRMVRAESSTVILISKRAVEPQEVNLYQAIFFDAGSTIIQITPRRQRIRFALASMGFVVQPVALEDAMSQVEERLSRTFDHVYTREQEADYWRQYYRGIMEALGTTDEDDSLWLLLKERSFYTEWTTVYPEVYSVLKLLKPGHKLGLISNAFPSLEELLDLLDLSGYFDSLVISALAGVSKPDARIFQIALEDLGVEAKDSLFVDDMEENVLAAEELGFTSFLIDRKGEYTDTNCWQIESLGEILIHVVDDFQRKLKTDN